MTLKLDSKEAIIQAAFELYNQSPSASLSDIAVKAGVGRATLHRHFKGRDELMQVLAWRAIDEIDTVASEASDGASSSLEVLRLVMAAIIPLANRQWFLAYENFDHLPDLAAAYQRQISDSVQLISAVKKQGKIPSQLPDIWLAHAYDNLIFAAWEMIKAEEATPKQAIRFAWLTFCEGCGAIANEESSEEEV